MAACLHGDPLALLQDGDPLVGAVRADGSKLAVVTVPPTAENLSKILLDVARGLLAGRGFVVIKVVCYETPNCWSEAS